MFYGKNWATLIACGLSASWALAAADPNPPAPATKPPLARTDATVTDYFGTKVADPYRWMEAANTNPELLAFLKTQNTYARAELAALPGRDAMLARIRQLDNTIPRVRQWLRGGSSLFYLEAAPGAKTAALFVRDATGHARKLLDPASLEEKGQHAAIDYFQPSWDGRYVVVGASLGGSEYDTIHIVEAASGRLLPETITRAQYGAPTWREDSKSFYYSRLQKLPPGAPPTEIFVNARVFLHVLGGKADLDPRIFGPGVSPSVQVPKAGFVWATVSAGCPYLIAGQSQGTTGRPSLYLAAANKDSATGAWRKIVSAADAVSTESDSAYDIHGPTLYLIVDKDAPNQKLLSLDLNHPDMAAAKLVIPTGDSVLSGVYAAKDALYVLTKRGVDFELQYSAYQSPMAWKTVPLPYHGTITNVESEPNLPGVVFRLESWTNADQAFAFDSISNQVTNTGLIEKFPVDVSGFEAREVEAASADGTKVPLSILCQKGLALDGSHPALCEGYGSYGISIDAEFDPRSLAFLEKGGVLAFAHVRGGGELGESWHHAGQKETKQHTIDDLVAGARYLIAQHYSSPPHLAVLGTSAGGIAVGGAIVQHPELFTAAIDNVGMTDMLRFQTTQGGSANVPEFGDISQPADFKFMYPISAYQHVVPGTRYPAVLGITGANDSRVASWMVAKMIARLQAASTSGKPIMLRVDFDEGHGLGSSRPQRESLMADMYSFVLWQSGDAAFQPASASTQN